MVKVRRGEKKFTLFMRKSLFLRRFFVLFSHPWILGVGTGVIATIVGGVLLFYWQEGKSLDAKRAEFVAEMKYANTLPLDSAIGQYEKLTVETRAVGGLSELLAEEEQTLGSLYLGKAEKANTQDLDEKAIASYSDALTLYTPRQYPKQYAQSLKGLGTAYYDLRDVSNYLDHLHLAASTYERILTMPGVSKYPEILGDTYNTLGAVFFEISAQENGDLNRSKALANYTKALTYITEKGNPDIHWAIVFNLAQIKLRTALVKFDVKGLQDGIESLTTMSKQLSLEEDEYHYLLCMLNIARAYSYLAIVQSSVSAGETANMFYDKVLTNYFKQTYPDIYPSAEEDKSSNDVRLAALSHNETYYQDALSLLRDSMTFDLYKRSKFLTAQNLQEQGEIYALLQTDSNHFSEAMDLYNQALDEFDQQVYPNKYALALMDRGILYSQMYDSDNTNRDALNHALDDFHATDTVALVQKYSLLHAQIQARLASAYTEKYSITHDRADAQKVIASADESIRLLLGTTFTNVVPYLRILRDKAKQETW